MAPAHAIDGPDAHDHATKQLAPELTIDGPQQDGYSVDSSTLRIRGFVGIAGGCSK